MIILIDQILNSKEIILENDKIGDIVKLYNDAVALCPNKKNDISYIVKLYVETISKTEELTISEKEEIYSAISVGAHSGLLWEKEATVGLKH